MKTREQFVVTRGRKYSDLYLAQVGPVRCVLHGTVASVRHVSVAPGAVADPEMFWLWLVWEGGVHLHPVAADKVKCIY